MVGRKELDAPPMEPIWWKATSKDGRIACVEAKLWYSAREAACRLLGVGHGELEIQPEAPEDASIGQPKEYGR